MIIISNATRQVLLRSRVIYQGSIGFRVPEEITVPPAMISEMEQLARVIDIAVTEAANCVMASLLESQGLQGLDFPGQPLARA